MEGQFEFLLRMGDSTLILGHRLSEWCGKGPALEEDIALANTALDLIGQTQLWLNLAGQIEGQGRDADRLAYHREAYDFRNLLLVERPNGDFAHTLMRQFLFDHWHLLALRALRDGTGPIADIAAKAEKEATYHTERSTDLVIGLGDGTPESHAKMQAALTALWPYSGEMLDLDTTDRAFLPDTIADTWHTNVRAALAEATLTPPDSTFAHKGGKTGARHSEHLGHLLAVMQSLPRAHPEAVW